MEQLTVKPSPFYFQKYLDFELCEKRIDNDGQLLIVKVKINSVMYILCNLYAPTKDHQLEQNNFISLDKNEFALFENENIIIRT